jgi:hypothetical protein
LVDPDDGGEMESVFEELNQYAAGD